MSAAAKTLLLVEDEALIAMNQKMQLEKIGYAVDHVLTGEAAVMAALSADSRPDLILMDIDLGKGIDGTQAAEQILNEIEIPIVFVSSHSEPKVVEKTEKITSYGYVVKNSGLTVLDASIKMAFKLFEARVHEQRHKADLLHSRDLMRYIIEHTRGAVAVHDRDLKYIYVSKQYLDQYNVQERDVIGKHHYDVFPDLPQKFRDAHQRALRGESSSGENDPYQRSDGTTVWTRWECRPWYEADTTIGGFIVYTEVLSQESTERIATRDTLNYLRSILRTTSDGFAVLDMDGHFLDVNDAACTMWGYPRDEFLQLSISDIAAEGNPELTAERIEKIRSNGYARFEAGNRRKDGTVFDTEVSASLLGGQPDSIIAFYRDITERKQAEEEVQRQLTEKETLLKEVHHRIKNNMGQIESLLSLQADSAESVEVQCALNTAISRVRSTRTLYEKLLIGKGYQDVSMQDYLESLIESHVEVYNDRPGVAIETRITDFALSSRKAVPVGIILNELLTNVFKYAFGGRADGHVRVELTKMDRRVSLTVQDNGVGFDERVAANTSTGFGLTLTKMLAEQLEGTFTIENDHGTKSVVSFSV